MKLDTVLRPVRDDLDNIMTSTFRLFDHPEIINFIKCQSDYQDYLVLYSSESLSQYWYFKRNEINIRKVFNI